MALTASQIEQLYVTFYNRPADPAGLAYWEGSGATYAQVANYFGASPEYTATFTGMNNTQIIAQIYENMFNRAPDAGGLIYWTNELTSGALTLGTIAVTIAYAALGTDATTLANKVAAATDFTNNINTTPEILAYSGAAGNAEASTWLATVGSSAGSLTAALAAEAAVIAGLVPPTTGTTYTLTINSDPQSTPTFTTGTQVPAGSLILNDASALGGGTTVTMPTGATVLASRLTVNAATGDAVTADVSGSAWSTVQTATVNGSGTVTLTGSAAQNLSITDSAAAATTITAAGGNAVTVSASGVTAEGTILAGTAATAGAITVTATENATQTTGSADAITVAGGTTDTISVNLTGAVNNTITGGVITVNGGAATTSVSVTQTAPVDAADTVSGVADGQVVITDVNSGGNTKAGTITSIALSGSATDSTIDDNNALTTLTLGGTNLGLIVTDTGQVIAGTNTKATTLTINANATTSTVTDSTVKVQNIVTGGATASTLTLNDTALTTVNISGTQRVTLTEGTAPTAITVTGGAGVTTTLGNTTSFTSTSTGTDVITISALAISTLPIAGNGTAAEEIVWAGAAAPAATAYLGSVTGFKVLGVNTAGNSESFDLSKVGTFTALDAQGGTNTTTFTKVAAGTTLAIDATQTGLVYQLAGTSAATSTLALTLGTASTAAGFTVDTLTADDSEFNGVGTINLASNTKDGSANSITTLNDGGLTALTVSGTGDLTVTNGLALNGAAFSYTDNSASTAAGTTFNGITDAALATLTIAGTNAVGMAIGGVTTSATSLTINDSSKGAVALGGLTDTALTSLTVGNTGAGVETLSSSTLNALATVNLSGKVLATIADGLTTGVTVSGSGDTSLVTLTLTGALATKADSIVLGYGAVTIAGTGAGTEVITLGNGPHQSVSDVLGTGTTTITVGTGYNDITLGAHAATVNYGAHVGVSAIDTLTVGYSDGVVNAVTTGLAYYDTIKLTAGAGYAGSATLVAATAPGNPTSLAAWISSATVAHTAEWFTFGGNTYIVGESAGTADAATSTVVELTGQLNLAGSTVGATGLIALHIA